MAPGGKAPPLPPDPLSARKLSFLDLPLKSPRLRMKDSKILSRKMILDSNPLQLLNIHAWIMAELCRQGITRSTNNPVGDLAEYLFCRAFNWKQAPNSARDADAIDLNSKTYQIKSRRLTTKNKSRQLGAIRKIDQKKFDCLAAVIFQETIKSLERQSFPIQLYFKTLNTSIIQIPRPSFLLTRF